jgi:2-C-methyl-D-erythritol 2,4-cyclodiphosphate synthase
LFRIGFGYDAHRLVKGLPLVLGGVEIPHPSGLEGHSDADVLIHAVVDALIGALGKGDIGKHFPDSDPAYKGISSLILLKKASAWLEEAGFGINNLDATIVAQKPLLSPYLDSMREKMAGCLGTGVERINLKAKTTETMGFCGREEGLEAYAVISIAAVQGEKK